MEDGLDLALDAPIDDAADTDLSGDNGDTGDTGDQGDQSGEQSADTAKEGDAAAADANFLEVRDGRLSPAAKATIDELRAKNPAMAKAVQRALFAEERLYRELPGGFKELAQIRQTVEQLGGENGIQDLQAETNGWREFDSLYTAGDPKVLEFLTETPEAQAAFLKIAPMAFEKYRQASPEGYSSYVAQVFVGDMVSNGIPLALERIQDHIADNPKAMAALKPLIDYVNRVGDLSKKQPAAPASPAKGDDARSQEFDKRDRELRSKEWGTETAQLHNKLYRDAIAKHLPGRKLSESQSSALLKLYRSNLSSVLEGKKDWRTNIDRFFGAKDKSGYLRYFESNYKEAVPRALRMSLAELGIGQKPGPKAGEKPGDKAKPATPAKAEEGFKLVSAKPNFLADVNRNLTTPQMWQSKKAILKNGTKVQWQ